eukprot:g38598.t1
MSWYRISKVKDRPVRNKLKDGLLRGGQEEAGRRLSRSKCGHKDFWKGIQLQLLTDRVRELQLELDELRIIREAEGVTERSYREIVTPKLQDKSNWVTVKREKGNRVRDISDQVYRILNREGEQPEVMVHSGTNDIARKRDKDLKSEYREL